MFARGRRNVAPTDSIVDFAYFATHPIVYEIILQRRMYLKVRNMALCGAFAALLALCAWISVPMGAISFTMQTFGVLFALGLLGGKWGSISILVYLKLGNGLARTARVHYEIAIIISASWGQPADI